MLTYFTLVIAGLGLFFAGMAILTEHLKQLTGRRFRLWVAHWTRNKVMGAVWGAAFFSVTQSAAATTFIVVSLLAAGLVGVVQALPMIVGLNIGSSVMVLVVTSDIKVIDLAVLGVAGAGYASQRFLHWRPFIRAVFGAGLLFLGLNMIQEGAAPLAQQLWVQDLLAGTSGSPLLGFALGALLVVLTQSSVAITVLAITFCDAGVFTLDQTIMIVYGTNLGSSLGTYLLSANLSGGPRQVSMYQVFYNIFGCLIFVPLFYLEWLGGIPLVKAFVVSLSDSLSVQLATTYLLFNLVPGLLLFFPIRPAARILQRFWPPSVAENDSRPQYLHEQALNEPESALELARLEHCRLFSYLPRYLLIARQTAEPSRFDLNNQSETFVALSTEIGYFLNDLAATNPSPETYQRLSESLALHNDLVQINATLVELVEQLVRVDASSSLRALANNLVEGLEAMLLTVNDCLMSGADELELELINGMLDGRRGVLQQIRDAYLSDGQGMAAEQKLQLLQITNRCERLFWLIGQLRPHFTESMNH